MKKPVTCLLLLLLISSVISQEVKEESTEYKKKWRHSFNAEGVHAWMHALIPMAISIKEAKKYIFMPIIAAVELIVYMILAILQFYTETGNKRMNNLWRDYNNYS